MGPLTPSIRTQELCYFHSGTDRGVGPVDLSVFPGTIVALIGPNGSGKSTLLGLLSTRLRPAGGTLELLGTPVAQSTLSALRRRLGVGFDHPAHVDELSGRSNAVFFARAVGGTDHVADRGSPGLAQELGLGAVLDEPVAGYSFGMRRKLALVEALAHRPALVLLDEPTVGLDASARAAFWRELARRKAAGATVVLASNELDDLAEHVDRVIFLVDGRVAHDDTPRALLASVEGVTRFEIHCSPSPPIGPDPAQGLQVEITETGLVVESRLGSAPLPGLLSDLIQAGVQIHEVTVRPPGLVTAFEKLTGVALDAVAQVPPESAARRRREWRRT